MSKFDRCIFIFIGLGIWALAMTQIFEPSSAIANYHNVPCGQSGDPCSVKIVEFSGLGFQNEYIKHT